MSNDDSRGLFACSGIGDWAFWPRFNTQRIERHNEKTVCYVPSIIEKRLLMNYYKKNIFHKFIQISLNRI